MIKTWIHAFLIFLLIPEDTAYLTGFVGQQVRQLPYVIHDLAICIKYQDHLSISHLYKEQFICIRKFISHCTIRNNARLEKQHRFANLTSSSQTYCGSLFLNKQTGVSSDMVMFINIMKGHILHHEVLKFNFKISKTILCTDHGLAFLYERHSSETYCGSRVPWTMIIPSDKSYIHLVTKTDLRYELSIFYSSSHKNWMSRFFRATVLKSPSIGTLFKGHNTYAIQYYLVTERGKHIYLQLISSGPVNGSVIIGDGPGRLSRVIYKLQNTKSPTNKLLITSTFLAFVEILWPHNTGTVLEIVVKIDEIIGKIPKCFKQGAVFHPDTSLSRRNVVCAGAFTRKIRYTAADIPPEYMVLVVKQFAFVGPNKLSDMSSSLCEYGGLSVKFDSGRKTIDFCGNMSHTLLFSTSNTIYIYTIWLYGYSQGYILATFTGSDCGTLNLGRLPSRRIHQLDFIFKFVLDNVSRCYFLVCPPVQTHSQRSCIIQFGPPSPGTTILGITTRHTLQPSEACLSDDNASNGFISYTLNATYTENWPFGLLNSTITSHKKYNTPQTHRFEFLQYAAVNLSLLCNKKLPMKQVSLVVKISLCGLINNRYQFYVANGIPALSDKCVGTYITFTTNINHSTNAIKNYHDFIFKGDGHITTGHNVLLEYKSCPVECRNFRYTVFVKSRDGKTILELTSPVGYRLFTGYYHTGFRVIITEPEHDCKNQTCIQILTINKADFPIGTIGHRVHRYRGTFLIVSEG